MSYIKQLGLVLVLVMTMATGFGCAKKTAEVAPVPAPVQSGSATAIDVAAQAITDGVVYFDFDKYDIKPEFATLLREKADLMRAYPSIRVRIEGNCDQRGTQEYNLALGERRARAAYEYMVRLGVNPSQLEMISYGKERPAVQGTGDSSWALNRRDDFRVINK